MRQAARINPNMKHRIPAILALLSLAVSPLSAQNQNENLSWDIYPDTWVGTDGAGRIQPTQNEAGKLKTDKTRDVGMFYITWHTQNNHAGTPPYKGDITKILRKDPSARLDGTKQIWQEYGGYYHWGEPELGYFLSADPYVIRHDLSALADAGVDVLILDVTNSVRYWEEWEQMFKIMEEMQNGGQKVPKFCFWVFNGVPIYCAQEIFERIYRPGRYKDLWYYRDGKPLFLYNVDPTFDAVSPKPAKFQNFLYDADAVTNPANPHYGDSIYTKQFISYYPQYILDFFTLRSMWWGYYKWNGKRLVGTEDYWTFGLDLGDKQVQNLTPRERASRHNGEIEEISVTPAQHPVSLIGKSWRQQTGEPQFDQYDLPVPAYVPEFGKKMERPTAYGIYFQDRWDEALSVDPSFIYLNDWNEWTAGKFMQDPAVTFMRRPGTNYFFVDQYNEEFNRTIGPMKGGFSDNYYMQMAANIRKYKGVRPIPENHGYFTSWDNEKTEYRDTKGDIVHRDWDGYSGLHYKDTLGRNDIVLTKVGVTKKNVMFRVSAADNISKPQPEGWMLLFLDTDKNSLTGWNGYDYMVSDGKLLKCIGVNADSTAQWKEMAKIETRVDGKDYYVNIPRKYIGAKGNNITFDFKWADNPADLKSPIGLALGGDTAPNRRFNYRYMWSNE